MEPEANKALIRSFFEKVINAGNLDVMDQILSTDFLSHEALPPGMLPPGRAGAKQLFGMLHNAFPDLHATIEDEIAEGDKVVVRVTFSGTQQGEFMGKPPTGRRVTYGVIDIFRISGEQVVEHWGIADILSLMQQIS